jgi:predicted kinase
VHDASDAGVEVIRVQRAREIGMVDWRRVDASRSEECMLQKVRTDLEQTYRPSHFDGRLTWSEHNAS